MHNKYIDIDEPYIYAAYPKNCEEYAEDTLETLSEEEIQFWYAGEINKKELQRIRCACAVIVFLDKDYIFDQTLRKIVDHAVKNNKNILPVYLEQFDSDPWTLMQLNSVQALFRYNFENEDIFLTKLKEAEIFRDMSVTAEQKSLQKRRVFLMIVISALSVAAIFLFAIYPLFMAGN